MTFARPIEHISLPTFLQNHSQLRPGLSLTDPAVFDQFLRRVALFSRGLVVVDSDLNNNEVFHHAAQRRDGLFWSAIRTGFLRRAARIDAAGNLLTQREVSENLRKSSRWRYDLIPADLPAELDAALSQAETGNPPVIWTARQVNDIFAAKVLAMLRGAAAEPGRTAGQLALMDRIAAWVREQRDTATTFGAADIESQLKPQDGAQAQYWEAVWKIILEAHTGNIPLVFGGRLAINGLPDATDRMLPAGPESGPEESDIKATLYAGSGQSDVRLEVRSTPSEMPLFGVNEERLDALSLEQIEELRESAVPGDFFDIRFGAAGSGAAMAAGIGSFRDCAAAFFERMARLGDVLTERAARDALRNSLPAVVRSHGDETSIVAFRHSSERYVEHVMMQSFPWVEGGPHVLGCDFTSLMSLVARKRAEAFLGGAATFYWTYKRPDYRVIERLGDAGLAGS